MSKVVLITGASSGIGEVTAERFGQAGWRVALAARRAAELERVAAAVRAAGGEPLVVATDMRDPAAIEAMVAAALAAWGRLDVVVANAGIGSGPAFHKTSDARMQEVVEVNLLGVIRTARAALPALLAAQGQFIAVSSVAGELVTPMSEVYSASKAGVNIFCDGLRRSYGPQGLRVSAVLPGFIETPLTAGSKREMPPPTIVSEAIFALVRRPRRRVVVPGSYRPQILFGKLLPGLADRMIANMARRGDFDHRTQR